MNLKKEEGIVSLTLKLAKKYKHFVKYAMIGVTGVSIDMFLFYILHQKAGMYYQLANLISVSCGISNNFILNAFLNFKMKDKILTRFIQFYSIGLLGLLISAGLLYLFIEHFLMSEILSKLITVAVVTVVQFNLNKIFTFKGYDEP